MITRIRKKVNGVVRCYFFFKRHKTPAVPRTKQEWIEITSRVLLRISPRTAAPADIPMVATPRNARKRTRTSQIETNTPTSAGQPEPLRRTSSPLPLFETGVWHDNKTRKLFAIADDEDIKSGLEKIVEILSEVLTKGNILPVLTNPHESLAEEPIPDVHLAYLFTKVRVLRLAYLSALEQYDEEGHSWRQCCTSAIDTLSKVGDR